MKIIEMIKYIIMVGAIGLSAFACDNGNEARDEMRRKVDSRKKASYSDKVKSLKEKGLAELVGEVERLDALPEAEIDKEVEVFFRRYENMRSPPVRMVKANAMDVLCYGLTRLGKTRVIRSMLKVAKDDTSREEFLYDCIGRGWSKSLRGIQIEWAETIDYKKKRHLIGMIKHLDNYREVAREIISDSEYGVISRCRATRILGAYGAREDIEFLEKYFGVLDMNKIPYKSPDGTLHYVPASIVEYSNNGRSVSSDCARDAAESIKERLENKH